MKIVEFIKKNISIFFISGVFFVLLSCVIFLTSINEPDYHGYARGFTIIIFTLGLFLFVIDFILKQLIKDKLNLKTTTSTKIKGNYFIINLFLMFTCIVNAQVTLSGKVITADNKPLELAEVILLTKDSIAIKSELTDGTGHFNLKTNPGKYKIQIRQIGKSLFFKEIEAVRNTDLGDIIVVLNENVLKEITVVARKKLIERKVVFLFCLILV